MSYNPSTREMITIIAQALGELNDNAVFVGGATVPFYLPDAYLSAARPTEDVDVVLEIVSSIRSKEVDETLYAVFDWLFSSKLRIIKCNVPWAS